MGLIEGEQKGGAWTAPAEGPAKGWGAEAVYPRHWERMAGLATGDAGILPNLRSAAGLSGHEIEPAPSGEGRRRRSGRAAVALGRRIRRSAAGARVGRARGVGARRGSPEEEIEWERIRRATSGSVRVATRWRRPPHVGQRSTC